HQRETCPYRIVYDVGKTFVLGAFAMGGWLSIKSAMHSPPGFRLRGAWETIRKHAPGAGGATANWGLAFACCDCSLKYVRKKEDPWNLITAAALASGSLQLRFGIKSAGKRAVGGGVMMAFFLGLGIALDRLS
ncbi:mitochondrial inner membrane translocase subunit Tim17/Tim22/Tim23/peroxisomal protein PMP24, partial [Haematococcus lacustris]